MLQVPPKRAVSIFYIYLVDEKNKNKKVILVPGSKDGKKLIRKKTTYNVTSKSVLAEKLRDAAWSGIPLVDLCKETIHAAAFVCRLEQQKRAVVVDGKVYAAAPIRSIKNLGRKFNPNL